MDLIVLLVAATLATYRLATDLAGERGPLDLYTRWRGAMLTRFGADDWRSEGVTCPICLSFWIGLTLVLVFLPISWLTPLWWLAVSGAAAWLARRDG